MSAPQAMVDSPLFREFCDLRMMHADKVEVSWDGDKHKWLVRIEAGSEVIRRHCNQARDANDDELRSAAQQTVIDDGYDVDQSRISVLR